MVPALLAARLACLPAECCLAQPAQHAHLLVAELSYLLLLSARLPDGKPFRMPGVMPRLSDTPGSSEWIGPGLGEHTDATLAALGYPQAEIARLRKDGAV